MSSKISDLTALTGAGTASGDLLPIVDVSAGATKKITRDELAAALGVAYKFNVKAYGAVGDGATNDTAAFLAAIAAAQANGGGTVFVPATTAGYSVATITINCSLGAVVVEGESDFQGYNNPATQSSGFMGSTLLSRAGADVLVFGGDVAFSGTRKLRIKGKGYNYAGAGNGVVWRASVDGRFPVCENMVFEDLSGHAIFHDCPTYPGVLYSLGWCNILMTYVANGIKLTGGPSTAIRNAYVFGLGQGGVGIDINSGAVLLDNCQATDIISNAGTLPINDNAGVYSTPATMFKLSGAISSATLNNIHCEDMYGVGVQLDGGSLGSVTFIGCDWVDVTPFDAGVSPNYPIHFTGSCTALVYIFSPRVGQGARTMANGTMYHITGAGTLPTIMAFGTTDTGTYGLTHAYNHTTAAYVNCVYAITPQMMPFISARSSANSRNVASIELQGAVYLYDRDVPGTGNFGVVQYIGDTCYLDWGKVMHRASGSGTTAEDIFLGTVDLRGGIVTPGTDTPTAPTVAGAVTFYSGSDNHLYLLWKNGGGSLKRFDLGLGVAYP